MIIEDEFENSITIECDCGCAILQFTQFKQNEIDTFITLYTDNFYALQKPGWSNFVENIKLIWAVITGKRYRFYEVSLNPHAVRTLIREIQQLRDH